MTVAMNSEKSALSVVLSVLCIAWLGFMIFFIVFIGRFSLMSLFGSIPSLVFVIVPAILMVAVLISRQKRTLGLIALVGLALGSTQFETNLIPQTPNQAAATDTTVKVMNWNTLMWDESKNRQDFFDFLVSQDADVYLLQEVLYSAVKHDVATDDRLNPKAIPITTIIPGLKDDYLTFNDDAVIKQYFPGYQFVHQQQFLVLSRYPITGSRLDASDQYQVVDIDVNGTPLRLFNVHVVLHLEFENPLQPYFYQALKRRFDARSLAFDRLYAEAEETPHDYIIAGDFNSPPTMGTIDLLADSHDDLFRYGTDKVPFTFEFNGMRIWRFDYVFANPDREFNVVDFENFAKPALSDHNAQTFTLALPNSATAEE